MPVGRSCSDVQGEGVVGLGEPGVEAVGEHRLGPADLLLGGLADQDDRPRPAVLVLGQPARGADEAGHVDVVAAGVHHADRLARRRRSSSPCWRRAGRSPRRRAGRRGRMRTRTVGPSPFLSTPTTPSLPTPVVTSAPAFLSSSAIRRRSRPPGRRARGGCGGADRGRPSSSICLSTPSRPAIGPRPVRGAEAGGRARPRARASPTRGRACRDPGPRSVWWLDGLSRGPAAC